MKDVEKGPMIDQLDNMWKQHWNHSKLHNSQLDYKVKDHDYRARFNKHDEKAHAQDIRDRQAAAQHEAAIVNGLNDNNVEGFSR